MDSWIINLSCLFKQLVIRNYKISTLLSPAAILLQVSNRMMLSFPFFAGSSRTFKEIREVLS